MVGALDALGAACPEDAEIIVVGGAAGILCRWIERATGDIDVAVSDPKLSTFEAAIASVANDLGLPERWLNDAAKGFARVLPPDYRDRLVHIGRFGRLEVYAISRRDFIVMKLFAMRAEDIDDLQVLCPTDEELRFARGQLPRIAAFEPKRAHLIELYIEQREGL